MSSLWQLLFAVGILNFGLNMFFSCQVLYPLVITSLGLAKRALGDHRGLNTTVRLYDRISKVLTRNIRAANDRCRCYSSQVLLALMRASTFQLSLRVETEEPGEFPPLSALRLIFSFHV